MILEGNILVDKKEGDLRETLREVIIDNYPFVKEQKIFMTGSGNVLPKEGDPQINSGDNKRKMGDKKTISIEFGSFTSRNH